MAAVDVDRLITALAAKIGQEFALKTGVTINISSVRRSGADGGTLVILGTITKDGVTYTPAGGWPIVWVNPKGGANTTEAAANAQAMLADLVK